MARLVGKTLHINITNPFAPGERDVHLEITFPHDPGRTPMVYDVAVIPDDHPLNFLNGRTEEYIRGFFAARGQAIAEESVWDPPVTR